MKKLARLTALLLTGALLLALTACGAAPLAPEQQAKQRLLGEINSYRATLEFAAPLEEVKQLSDAEQIWVEQFRAAGKTELPESTTNETHQKWASMTGNWTRCDTFGLGMKKDASGELIDILLAKVPANTPEGKAELSEALKHPAFNRSACTKIGIAVVTIDGQMYWTCSVYSRFSLSPTEQHPLNQTKPDSLRAVRLLILLGLQAVTYSCTYPDSSSGNHRW